MIASFEYELIREDDEQVYYLEVIYSGVRYDGEYEAELISVMLDGKAFDTTSSEDNEIIEAALEQIENDFIDEECAYGDYINDMRQGR